MPAREVRIGTRVVVRYRRPPGSVPALTDALGILEQTTPQLKVRTADGRAVHIDPADVTVIKAVPQRPVTVRAVRWIERALARSRAGEDAWEPVAGWWVHPAHPAVPVATPEEDGGQYFGEVLRPPAVAEVAAWYRERGHTARLRLPERVTRPPADWPIGDPVAAVLAHDPDGLAPAKAAAAPVIALDPSVIGPSDSDVDPDHLGQMITTARTGGSDAAQARLVLQCPPGRADELTAAGLWLHHRVFQIAAADVL